MKLKQIARLCGALLNLMLWMALLWALIYGVHFQIDGVPHLLKFQ